MVSKLEARGMPVDDVTRARRWRKRHLQPGRLKGVRRDTVPTDGMPLPISDQPTDDPADQVDPDNVDDDIDDIDDIDPEDAAIRSYRGARDRKEHYQAELARMAYQREAGQLMERSKVISMMFDSGTAIRLHLEALAPRLAPTLAAITDELRIQQILDQEMFQVLTTMSKTFERMERAERGLDVSPENIITKD